MVQTLVSQDARQALLAGFDGRHGAQSRLSDCGVAGSTSASDGGCQSRLQEAGPRCASGISTRAHPSARQHTRRRSDRPDRLSLLRDGPDLRDDVEMSGQRDVGGRDHQCDQLQDGFESDRRLGRRQARRHHIERQVLADQTILICDPAAFYVAG